jgi:hypothetical protein
VTLFLGLEFVRLDISSEVRLGTQLGILLGIHGGRLRLGIAWSRQLGTTFGQLGGWSGRLGISSGQLGHIPGISVVQVGQFQFLRPLV